MPSTTHPDPSAGPAAAPQRPANGRRRGFTILELIVVLVMLGLLTAIAVPSYNALLGGADIRTARSSHENIARTVGASLKLNPGADPAGTLASEANPLMNGDAFTVTEDAGAASYSTSGTDMNFAVNGTYLAWAAFVRDGTGSMCRVGLSGGSAECWIHTGDGDTHDGDTALAGP